LPTYGPRGSVAARKFFVLGLGVLAIVALIAVRVLRGRIPSEPKAASEGPPVPTTADASARKVSDVRALAITLDINEKPSLFVILNLHDFHADPLAIGTGQN
jgi:hypothetical protein